MFPRERFILASRRPFSEEEQEEARAFLSSKPHRVARAWLIGIGAWPLIIGALMFLDGVFGPDDESFLKLGLSIPLMLAFLVAPAVAICLGLDASGKKKAARQALTIEAVEVWERCAFLGEEEPSELPLRIEVVSGTYDIWSIQYDEGDEEEDDTGNFNPKPAS